MGGTKSADDNTLHRAASAGRAVAENGYILLTGGEPVRAERSVKARAMLGAMEAGNSARPIGVIGIVPNGAVPGSEIRRPSSCNCYELCLSTGVSSHERNVLTGGLPDAVIALSGEAGTLSEIAYALAASRPVVFLNSWTPLRDSFDNDQDQAQVRKIIDVLHEESLRSTQLVQTLDNLFRGRISSADYAVLNGVDASTAVRVAASLALGKIIGSSPRTRYPGLERSTLRSLKKDFEEGLRRLEKKLMS